MVIVMTEIMVHIVITMVGTAVSSRKSMIHSVKNACAMKVALLRVPISYIQLFLYFQTRLELNTFMKILDASLSILGMVYVMMKTIENLVSLTREIVVDLQLPHL